MFLQEKSKSVKLTKPNNILLHNDISMDPPVHLVFLSKPYESCRQLPINVFVTLPNSKQRPPRSKSTL